MGSAKSSPILTQELLEEYILLTYLSKAEIISLYKLLGILDHKGVLQNLEFRFPVNVLENLFPQLQCNPFKDRIFRVFSSKSDECLSFEDILDLCSVLSTNCPREVKAHWAFRIFDFDGDDEIGESDLKNVISRLTSKAGIISEDCKDHIIKILLNEMDMTATGKIGQLEFVYAVGKMSEFSQTFCFRF